MLPSLPGPLVALSAVDPLAALSVADSLAALRAGTVAQLDPGLAAVAVVVPAITAVALGLWVYQDARARDSDHPVAWGVAALLPPLLLAYVLYRDERTRPQSDRERLTLSALLALLLALIAGTTFSPPDVYAQGRTTLAALVVTVPLFYLLVYRNEPDSAGEGAS